MALQGHEAIDEEEFYGQGFRTDGVVSVWAGLSDNSNDPEGLDVLQDLCGVGYYNIDNQEGNCKDFQLVPIRELISELSYSASFVDAAVVAARRRGLVDARWVLLQYDFAYDPVRVKRPIASDPDFIGVFSYI